MCTYNRLKQQIKIQFKNVKKQTKKMPDNYNTFFSAEDIMKCVVLDPTDKTFWKIINVPQIKEMHTAWKWVVVHNEKNVKQLALDFQEIT